MPTTDDIEQLLSRAALGDRQAFDSLYAQTSAKLFGVALRLLKNRTEAEDALQEIYVRIWQRADRYSAAGASPISWLTAIARNHAIDRLRARKPGAAEIDGDATDLVEAVADAAPGPEAAAIQAAERRRIEACLDRLDDDKADAVRLAYVEGFAYRELADRFAVPLNTMRTWLRRSLIKLRECLDE